MNLCDGSNQQRIAATGGVIDDDAAQAFQM